MIFGQRALKQCEKYILYQKEPQLCSTFIILLVLMYIFKRFIRPLVGKMSLTVKVPANAT